MRDPRPIDPTPEAILAWASGLRPLVREIRVLADDATKPRGQRLHTRTHLRKMVCQRLHDLERRLEMVDPGGGTRFDRAPSDAAHERSR